MKVLTQFPLIDEILGECSEVVGNDLPGYRNHVYRMVNFTLALGDFNERERETIAIAGSFHDIGIWPGDNLDYLPPSIARAKDYLERNDSSSLLDEIATMIGDHHKLRRVTENKMVEAFRKGDLADFSLGLIKSGLPASYVQDVKAAFPNAGFHRCLVRVASRWIVRHPFNPVPIIKW